MVCKIRVGRLAMATVAAVAGFGVCQVSGYADDSVNTVAPAPTPATVPDPITAAKTIQYIAELTAGDTTKDPDQVEVSIDLPNKFSATLHLHSASGPRVAIDVNDGVSEHEADSIDKTFRTLTPNPNGKSSSQLFELTGADLVFDGGTFGTVGKNVVRQVSDVSLDGKNMILITDTSAPHKFDGDGKTYHDVVKLWTDASTGLPYRREYSSVDDTDAGKVSVFQRLTFTKWTFDAPVTVAWAQPAGYTSHVDPTLLQAGVVAPNFTAMTPDGKKVKLSDYIGKPVVLDFWATWCGPCQHSMPHLESVYDQVKAKGVVVLAVCVFDNKPAYDKWVKAKKSVYTFATAFDPAGQNGKDQIPSHYGVNGIPTQFVIGPNGKIVAGYTGYDDGDTRLNSALASIGYPTTVTPAATGSAG